MKISDLIQFRKDQKRELEDEIVSFVAAAIRQQDRIEHEQPGWKDKKKDEKGELLNVVGRFLDSVRSSTSILHGADDEIHDLVKKLVAQAEKDATEDPDKEDHVFAGVNARLSQAKDQPTDQSATKKRKVSKEDTIAEEEELSLKAIKFEMKRGLKDHVHR
jgi:hypothetical protein